MLSGTIYEDARGKRPVLQIWIRIAQGLSENCYVCTCNFLMKMLLYLISHLKLKPSYNIKTIICANVVLLVPSNIIMFSCLLQKHLHFL